ncbi:mitochondrial K+-H+ exchange-related-domain-containing protein [Lineolata rhizophorae]|uniref:Mitochondrial K+-H+ exchange-related-domain-containing protein n=1 Tax=Lineolata rhizophorae TaxID=578093 RepID=A0A6A6NXU8_9PEZI|nr:mitochondrial K+-H+ exchange-related-domain-containing protein [Lineolata rhizophorae]
MRLYLLPLSTRARLIYCARAHAALPGDQQTLLARNLTWLTSKANTTWASWEASETRWKVAVTGWGNRVLARIPYQEWGLKTIPPLSGKRRALLLEAARRMAAGGSPVATRGKSEGATEGQKAEETGGGATADMASVDRRVEVLFPRLFLPEQSVLDVLRRLATERQDMHRSRLIWSFLGMPLTAPFMLVPIIPNIPFFYLVFRAYSHWKALAGSRHLEFLLNNSLIKPVPMPLLDSIFASGLAHSDRKTARDAPLPTAEESAAIARKALRGSRIDEKGAGSSSNRSSSVASSELETEQDAGEEIILLRRWNGKLLAERVGLPEMEVEIERAVEQVEKKIEDERKDGEQKEKERKDEKKEGG